MATVVSSEPCRPARPRCWRRIFQFSLRTLLILTTLAAVGCWWYLQPKVQVEELAGGALRLRRQVRPRGKNEFVYNRSTRSATVVDVGAWQLRDGRNEPLAIGRYAEGQPHGWWRIYHANGRKAAEGRMVDGLRVGVWKTWNKDGRRESEVTYDIEHFQEAERPPDPAAEAAARIRASVDLCGSVAGGFGKSRRISRSGPISQRHGASKSWHPNGELRDAGMFQHDLREGAWSFYDDRGRLIDRGSYHDGRREGSWTVHSIDGTTETMEFIGGRLRAEHERLVAQLRFELESGDVARQIVAMEQAESLGRHEFPLLVELLCAADDGLKLLALRRLERLAADSEGIAVELATEKELTALLNSANERVAMLASLVFYELIANRREESFGRLIENVRRSSDRDGRLAALFTAWRIDPERRPVIFGEIARATNCPQQIGLQFASSEGLVAIVNEASQSADAHVRRLAIEVVVALTRRGPPEVIRSSAGDKNVRYPVPDSLKNVVERAKTDSEPAIREAADAVGKWPDPRMPVGGSIGIGPFLPGAIGAVGGTPF